MLVQGQEVVGAGPPLIVVMMRGMVMPLPLRGGLLVIGNRPDEVDDGRKPSKVRYILVVQYGLSTGQKTFFWPSQRRLTIHFTVFVDF